MAQVNDLNMRLDISSGHLEKARETNMALEHNIGREGVFGRERRYDRGIEG